MRSSYDCESNRAPLLCYLPCLPKSKEDAGGGPVSGSASLAAVAEKPPLVQKIEAVVVAPGGGEDEEGCKEVPVAPKSSLKRADCVDGKRVAKGNVKWMDLVGKELTQVKEFEPSDSEDSDDEDANPCTCVIL